MRDFNIGLNRSEGRQDLVLREKAVALAARLSARIVTTVYPYDEDE